MTTSSTRQEYAHVVHEATVDGGWSGKLRIVRGRGINDQDLVFVDSDLLGTMRLLLTPQEAADVAEVLHEVSGLQTSTYGAPFLAEVHREQIARKGLSRRRVAAATGITAHRLRRTLSGEVPMTHEEHVAISEVEV